jgi:hypothetical protein
MLSPLPYIYCPQLLQSLESELFSQPLEDEPPMLEKWAKEVVQHLCDGWPDKAVDAEKVLYLASSALWYIMRSESWEFLLEDALQRPRVFARTMLLMMHGQAKPSPA